MSSLPRVHCRRRVRVWPAVAALVATFFAAEVWSQPDRSREVGPNPIVPARRPGPAHFQLQSKWELPVPAPENLLRLGDQSVLLSNGSAALLAADGGTRPLPGWRDLRDFGCALDARSAYLAGGISSGQVSATVWRVGLDSAGLSWARVAELPAPCAKPTVVLQGGNLFVAGRSVVGLSFFVRIKITDGTVTVLELPPRFLAARSLGAQGDTLYLDGQDTDGAPQFWRRRNDAWSPAGHPPGELLALPPVLLGQAHLIYASGDRTRPLLAYHTITDTWTPLPATAGVTEALAPHRGGVLRIVRDSGGRLALLTETLVHPKRGLSFLDYAMLAGYFALNLGIGFLCARRKVDSDDYFRGGGRIQWWALGISYMATAMSSISFMAYPAMGYGSNWLLIGVPVFQSAAVIVAGLLFIGIFRRLNITTVFEYLEQRFGRAIRLFGAALMVLGQVGGRLSIVMLLPSMAFSAVTGLNVYLSVLLMGGVTVVYCLKGGMKAVVWTDVLQFALMYGTIAIALVTIGHEVPGGFGGLVAEAYAADKFKAFLFDWDFVRPSVWVFSCLAVTTVFLQLGDQSLMQRALSAQDEKAARNSVVLAGALNLPIALMLFFVGSALFVFYRHQPGLLDPALPNDSIFPFFVGNELPSGIVGLIIAGIFAAAMSTVSGTINAISAIAVRDFLLPVRPNSSEATQLKLARVTTLVVGGLATGIATAMAGMNIQSLWETFATLMALIGGGFPGIFALGLLTRRANAWGVAIGLVTSIGVTLAVKHATTTNVFLYTSVAVGSCIAVGYGASFLFPPTTKSLAGLTIHTLRDRK